MTGHSVDAAEKNTALTGPTLALTALAMLAFAGNSLLCRLALQHTDIDAATFTSVRIAAGACVLCGLAGWRATRNAGSWASALALFVYAAAFSLAYLNLPAGMGALMLFGAVQVTMIGHSLWRGERLGLPPSAGLVLALGGLLALLLPSTRAALPLSSAALMLLAGVAWGVYSVRGAGPHGALASTAGNFARALPFAALLSLLQWPPTTPDATGLALAAASGALASGVGYAIWYAALRGLRGAQAAAVQLTVPVIAALGGVALLGETITWQQTLACTAVLGGVALVLLVRFREPDATTTPSR